MIESPPCQPGLLDSTSSVSAISSSQNFATSSIQSDQHAILNWPSATPKSSSSSITAPKPIEPNTAPTIQYNKNISENQIVRQNDSFSEAYSTLHANITQNAHVVNPQRSTIPIVLPAPPSTAPVRSFSANNPGFRHPSQNTFRKPPPRLFRSNPVTTPTTSTTSMPFAPPPVPSPATRRLSMQSPSMITPVLTTPSNLQSSLPPPMTPSQDEDRWLNSLLESLDSTKDASHPFSQTPEFGSMLFGGTDTAVDFTPALISSSPVVDLITQMAPAVRHLPDDPFQSPAIKPGVFPGFGQFGFMQADQSIPQVPVTPQTALLSAHQGPMSLPDTTVSPDEMNILGILQHLETGFAGTGTVSPTELYTNEFTPSTYTPSLAHPTPVLSTPGPGSHAILGSGSRKRPSPVLGSSQERITKRLRAEDEAEQPKKKKHTGTRPGLTSHQLVAPGAPPQPKTYLTQSATSRKDLPSSYKMKAGDLPDDAAINKIVAKRTANRDSARRSRMRKQAAMEHATRLNDWYKARINQLEECIRANGIAVPEPLSIVEAPDFGEDDGE